MLYDVRLELHYEYEAMVHNDRHHVRVMPLALAANQRVVAASLAFDPKPDREASFTDFFGNAVTSISYGDYHDHLDVRLTARVAVEQPEESADLSPPVSGLGREIAGIWSLEPASPHHFLGASPRIGLSTPITEYARQCLASAPSVTAAALALCLAINRDFAYDPKVTKVDTTPEQAFALRRGVCQDFAHVMIAGLRGLGIPAGYVSGFLRTIPPKGETRLEGADAMHAWVRVWCGQHAGWREFDPTNAMPAGTDHITIGYGRDYGDISPIVGVLKTSGDHKAKQSVDVVRVE